MLIPVPGPQGGVVVIGESVIAYVRKKRSADDQAVKSIQINATIIKVQHRQLSSVVMGIADTLSSVCVFSTCVCLSGFVCPPHT